MGGGDLWQDPTPLGGAAPEPSCETLVLLSVHGDNLFRSRLGFDVVGQVNALIRDLLTPLDGATWQSQQHDLPRYAEAAPEVFLELLEDDLRSPRRRSMRYCSRPAPGPFSWPGRTGLLWALEALAWNPNRLSRWSNCWRSWRRSRSATTGPTSRKSRNSIFRCWMPQTAAPVETRIAALELLCRRHPAIGWRICLNQFDGRATIGHHSSRPAVAGRRRRRRGAGSRTRSPPYSAARARHRDRLASPRRAHPRRSRRTPRRDS